MAPQPVPVAPQPVPVAPQSVPVAPQPVPVAPQPVPVAPQPVPVAPQPIPVAPRPVAPVAQPMDPNRPPPAIGSPLSPYAFKSYRLGYMQSDRVIALLKSLGYATVEFAATRGESVNESIFTVIKQVDKYPLVVKIIDAAKTS